MLCRLWFRFYEKEPVLACMLGGALFFVPIVPLAAIVIDGTILVLTAISGLICSGASATCAMVGRERERQYQLSLAKERTRREQLLNEERALAAANAPPQLTMHDRLAALRSRHIEQCIAIEMLPIDEPARESLQLEQEERFTEAVRSLFKKGDA